MPVNKLPEDEEGFYDQVEIEDMTFDANLQSYWYPCPCGDKFWVSIDDLREGQDVAVCPSCSLIIQVIYEPVSSESDCYVCITNNDIGGLTWRDYTFDWRCYCRLRWKFWWISPDSLALPMGSHRVLHR